MSWKTKILVLGLGLVGMSGCGSGANFTPNYPVGPQPNIGAAPSNSGLQFFRRNASAPLAVIDQVFVGEVVPLELKGAAESEIVHWSSSDTALGSFFKPGELHLRAAGSFQIQASAGDKQISLNVTVGQRPVVTPPISPMPEPTSSPEASPTPSATPTASPLATPSASPTPTPSAQATATPSPTAVPSPHPSDPFIDQVISFTPGSGAGYGSDQMPGIILGAPKGYGLLQGSLDTLSLGSGGVIVLKSATPILNGSGPDFIVFENAFYANGNPNAPFAELGEVSVSQDGSQFFKFNCQSANGAGGYPGCAGVSPVLANAEFNELDPLDPAEAGGDAFDLNELGLSWAYYIRIRDLSAEPGTGGNAGFDLDAIGILHQ